jgi:hypothetical protein
MNVVYQDQHYPINMSLISKDYAFSNLTWNPVNFLGAKILSLDARDLADMYFFEMLVRTHIAEEGVPYIGLKQKGLDLGSGVPTAD